MTPTKAKSGRMEYDFTNLNKIVKAIDNAGHFVVKVGIFGSKTSRTTAGKLTAKLGHRKATKEAAAMTNAEVGLTHEMGSPSRNIPQRSFLRLPLELKSKQIIDETYASAQKHISNFDIKAVLNLLGAACVKQILLAFASWGFGQWPADTVATVQRKGSNTPLIDTGQLRRSITWKVEER